MQREIHAHAVLTGVTGMVFGDFSVFHALVDSMPGCEGIGTIGLAEYSEVIATSFQPLLQPAWDAILDSHKFTALPVIPTDVRYLSNTIRSYSPEQWNKFAEDIKDVVLIVNWPQCLDTTTTPTLEKE